MKRWGILALICLLLAGAIMGCGGSSLNMKKVEVTTVGVAKDGTVKEMVVEKLDQTYYSFDDMSAFINEQVEEFNSENPSEDSNGKSTEGVTVDSIDKSEENDQVRVGTTYASADIYTLFTGQKLQVTDVSDSGLLSEYDYVEYKSGDNKTYDDFSSESGLKAVVTDFSVNVMVAGKVVYYSKNVVSVDKNTCTTADGEISVIIYM